MGEVGVAIECGEVRTGEVKGEVSTEGLLSLELGAEEMCFDGEGTDLSTTPLSLLCSAGLSGAFCDPCDLCDLCEGVKEAIEDMTGMFCFCFFFSFAALTSLRISFIP